MGERSAKISRARRPAFSSSLWSSGSNLASLAASSRSWRTRSTRSTTGFSKGRTNELMGKRRGWGCLRGPKGVASRRVLQALPYDAMGQTKPPPAVQPKRAWTIWRALLGLAVLRLALNLALGRAGLHALSDDDYARVAIAEAFAGAPRLDPSHTSWLPFPFW